MCLQNAFIIRFFIKPRVCREIIARGWTSTSERLEKMNDELQRTKSELDKTSQENETLKVATKTVAEDLVKSIKEAYEEHGSAPPERYMREIESQTCANPTLAQYVCVF